MPVFYHFLADDRHLVGGKNAVGIRGGFSVLEFVRVDETDLPGRSRRRRPVIAERLEEAADGVVHPSVEGGVEGRILLVAGIVIDGERAGGEAIEAALERGEIDTGRRGRSPRPTKLGSERVEGEAAGPLTDYQTGAVDGDVWSFI